MFFTDFLILLLCWRFDNLSTMDYNSCFKVLNLRSHLSKTSKSYLHIISNTHAKELYLCLTFVEIITNDIHHLLLGNKHNNLLFFVTIIISGSNDMINHKAVGRHLLLCIVPLLPTTGGTIFSSPVRNGVGGCLLIHQHDNEINI